VKSLHGLKLKSLRELVYHKEIEMSDLDTAILSVDDDELADRAKAELKDLRKRLALLESLLPADEQARLAYGEFDLGKRAYVSGGEIIEV
jgi:hypothetical protein